MSLQRSRIMQMELPLFDDEELEFLVKLKACCPARSTLLRVTASSESEARGKALKHCNRGFLRKDWTVMSIREVGG